MIENTLQIILKILIKFTIGYPLINCHLTHTKHINHQIKSITLALIEFALNNVSLNYLEISKVLNIAATLVCYLHKDVIYKIQFLIQYAIYYFGLKNIYFN